MALTWSFFWVYGWLCPITRWTLFHSSTCTEMWLLGRELRNAVVLFKRRFANLLRLFGNKRWSSVHPQIILTGHHMAVVKNSHGIFRTCQGMLQHFPGGLWSEAKAHDLLGSIREMHALAVITRHHLLLSLLWACAGTYNYQWIYCSKVSRFLALARIGFFSLSAPTLPRVILPES